MSDFHLATKPTTPTTMTKAPDTPAVTTPIDKIHEDVPKSTSEENPDGEEIADDLSEISDEADEILGQQEVFSSSLHFYTLFLFLF